MKFYSRLLCSLVLLSLILLSPAPQAFLRSPDVSTSPEIPTQGIRYRYREISSPPYSTFLRRSSYIYMCNKFLINKCYICIYVKLHTIESTYSFTIMSKVQKKYSIVEFPDGIQIVPSCWINRDESNCIWPSYVKSQCALDKLLAKAVVPSDSVKWDTCKIKRIFGSADTWERAQEKLVNAAETSTIIDSEDFSEEEWRSLMKKRRRNNARKIYDSVSSDENEECTLYHHRKESKDDCHHAKKKESNQINYISQLPSLPKPPTSLSSQSHVISNVLLKASRTDETQHNISTSDNILSNMSSDTICSLPSSHFRHSTFPKEVPFQSNVIHDSSATDFKNYMTKSIMILLRRTKNIEDKINNFEIRQGQAENKENEEEFANLLCTEEQLLEFDKKLKNPVFFKKMSSYLKMIGGDKITTATNGVLGKLIANVLATKYSWQGRKGKKAFAELQISKLIIKTVHMICPTQSTDAQIIEAASTWLAQATTRLKRAQTKTIQEHILLQNNSMEQDEDDNNVENTI